MNRHDEHESLKKAHVQISILARDILHMENLRILRERDIKELKKRVSWLEAENAILRRRANAHTAS
jgi:hypothetical protein